MEKCSSASKDKPTSKEQLTVDSEQNGTDFGHKKTKEKRQKKMKVGRAILTKIRAARAT